MHSALAPTSAVLAAAVLAGPALARSAETDARAGIAAFVDNCFSPHLTAARAAQSFNLANVRHDFYDLRPFSAAEPSLPLGSATEGTDRRCEVSFRGDYAASAADAAVAALEDEGITTPAELPATHTETSGTVLLAARKLNANRTAVVHVGTRPGANGIETFMNVERLEPQK